MIDTHCHLTFPDYLPENYPGAIDAVMRAAAADGVTGAITISTTTQDCLQALSIAKRHDRIWCTAGVHPLYADQGPHDWQNLRFVASDPKCVAWGELGLDSHYDDPPKSVQRAVLDEQLAFIESSGITKPVEIHCRKAFEELIPILKSSKLAPDKFVFHCFTGTPADMRLLLDFGAHVSLTGVITYKNADDIREAVKLAPLDRIMVETDAPFLSPDIPATDGSGGKRPSRPKRNEPRHVRVIAEKLAEIKQIPFDEMHRILNANTSRFFGIDAR